MNFIKTSLRSLFKSRLNASVSLLGLTVGFFAGMLILQYVFFETNYDKQWKDYDRVYRVVDHFKNATTANVRASSFYATANAVVHELPEVELAGQFIFTTCIMKRGDVLFREKNVALANRDFFRIFSFELVDGTFDQFEETNSVVIARSVAEKYFGKAQVVGELIDLQGLLGMDYVAKVAAVFEDIPANSHLRGEVYVPMSKFDEYVITQNAFGPGVTLESMSWRAMGFFTYIKVHEGADIAAVDDKLTAMGNRHRAEVNKEMNQQHDLKAQPIAEIHTTPGFSTEVTPTVDSKWLYAFYLVAALIVVMAWVNYINMAIARAMNRAKEVGIRKVLGSSRAQLVIQFMTESLLIGFAAFLIALALSFGFHTRIEDLLERHVFSDLSQNMAIASMGLATVALGAVLAGIYPALVLTSYNPVKALKGKLKSSASGIALRRSLITFQFFIAMAMLCGLFVVKKQISFMVNSSTGMDLNQIISVRIPGGGDEGGSKMKTLKDELSASGHATKASVSSIVPGIPNAMQGTARAANRPDASIYAHLGFVDYDFAGLFNLEVIAGRGFSEEFTGDQSVCLINRKTSESLGFANPSDAIDLDLIVRTNHSRVVGVVENFNFTGLQMGFEPMVMELDPTMGSTFLNVMINTQDIEQSIAHVQHEVHELFPNSPFEYQFLDEAFAKQYGEDRKFGTLFMFFSVIALFLACLGLFGVAAFMAQQRAKEIAIRKVLGSSLTQVFVLLNREYVLISAVSYVVSVPVVYLVMSKWLEPYHHKISMEAWMFVVPFLLVQLIVVTVTISQTYAAAVSSPTGKLRE